MKNLGKNINYSLLKSYNGGIAMNSDNKLHLFMDETSAPYEEGKNPYPRTKKDDEFDDYIIAKLHLVTKEEEKKINNQNHLFK